MSDVLNAAEVVTVTRSNLPADPFEAFKLDLESLFEEAGNFLDGQPIATQAQADDVSALVNRLRKSIGAADEARKKEKRPHDEAAAAVQTKWLPVIDRAGMALSTAKSALSAFLSLREAEQRAAAEAATQEARRLAEAAAQAASQARPDDLAGQTTAKVLQEQAAAAQKAAEKADKARPQAKGGERAVGLRSRWTATLTSPADALRHYRQCQPDALKEWLTDQAQRDVNGGSRKIPGFEITESKVAV